MVVMASLFWVIFATDAWGQMAPEAIEEADEDCLDCHEDLDPDEREFEFPDGTVRSFVVVGKEIRASAHGKILSCLSCHEGYDERHRGFPEESVRAYDAARAALCERCHEGIRNTHPGEPDARPLCTECHSAHRDRPRTEPGVQYCGRGRSCHPDAFDDLAAGGHADPGGEGGPNPDLPNCATCHPQHREPDAPPLGTRMEVTARCIECHSRELLIRKYGLPDMATQSYGKDFHGITFQHLWAHPTGEAEPEIMICADCHGPHKVGPLTPDELFVVCSRCHEDADESIVGAWLGHEKPSPRHGTLVWLVRFLYYVFIPVVVIGLILNILMHGRHRFRHDPVPDRWARQGTNGGAPPAERIPALPATIIRFRPLDRVEHLAAMILFTILVLTGIPQSYPQSSIGSSMIDGFGGIASTRIIHRTAGFIFAALAVLHLGRGILGVMRTNRLPAMVPTRKDFRDAVQNLMFYLGKGKRPTFGRFDYRQKFEYWGLFLGGVLMTVTGLMLIYPEAVSHFLPGIFLAAARVAHGLEATLAVLVVVTWHFYEVILRPEIFPMDTTIFTGRMTVDRLRREHTLEYERLFPK